MSQIIFVSVVLYDLALALIPRAIFSRPANLNGRNDPTIVTLLSLLSRILVMWGVTGEAPLAFLLLTLISWGCRHCPDSLVPFSRFLR